MTHRNGAGEDEAILVLPHVHNSDIVMVPE